MKNAPKKESISILAGLPQTPVFPQTLHRLRPNPEETLKPQAAKRENVFSKSRDLREDRGTREMKTSHNAQTLTHNGQK